MKRIKYVFLSAEHNYGTEESPDIRQVFIPKDFIYSEEGFEAAQREAYNGEYEIYDDGQPEPEPTPSEGDSAVWGELDSAYQEGVDSV